jgi:serine/threonine-protein kinase
MSIKCPKCHFENPDETLYCGKCATPLPTAEDVSSPLTKTLETPVEELARGTTFAKRYELIEELGRGGMGRVYKVFDKKIKEEVAIKILKPEIVSDETTIERFSNELKLARKIIHKNVGRMYELMEEEGTHFITMEYVAGEDLKTFIRRVGQLPTEKSVFVAKQVCEGLVEAHKLGVVHRDLKPGNIMIDKDGNARVMDFGIARSLKGEGITTKGVIVGTPDYMSPEQVDGKEADHRSDIYSLGIILYEMLTGRVPFEGDTSFSVALKHKTEMPKDPRELNAQIPESISHLILKCMQKKREDRYQSVDEILDELKHIKADEVGIKGRRKWIDIVTFRRKEKAKKPQKFTKKILKYGFRAILVFLAMYLIISIMSLINDSIFERKLEEIRIEHDVYYKNLFPLQKDWLPEGWRARSGNSFDNYMKLFPTKQDKEGKTIPNEEYYKDEYNKQIRENPSSEEYKKIFRNFDYKNTQELKVVIEDWGKYYKFEEFFNAVKCSKLNPSQLIENDQRLSAIHIVRYLRMITLSARIDFLEGNYEKGLNKILNSLLFAIDLTAISHSYFDHQFPRYCLNTIYRELIPLFLSKEIDYDQKIVKDLEQLISLALIKFEPESVYYREYLWIGKHGIREFLEYLGRQGGALRFKYYLFGKLVFWKNGFSVNRDVYKMAGFYKALFEGLKYIRNIRDKGIFIMDYLNKTFSPEKRIFPDYYSFYYLAPSLDTGHFVFNIMRTFGKLALIVLCINRYGINSPEFIDLRVTDTFINELSGKPFEIVEEGEDTFIVLSEDYKLNLKKIDYIDQHRDILKSFEHFTPSSMDEISSLFYSFDLE